AAAFGGLNRIDFAMDGSFTVRPLVIANSRLEDLNSHLMMFFTGQSRTSSVVAQSKIENFSKRENHLKQMRVMVDEGEKILCGTGSLDDFGKLLDHSWNLKRELSDKVSNSAVDDIYAAAMEGGAVGGKLMGAGGGGFMVFYVPPEKQASVRTKLSQLIEV